LLNSTDLSVANLSRANLWAAHLSEAKLSGANLRLATVGFASFSNVSLVGIEGLETINHRAPSTIGVDTLERTAADLSNHSSDRQQHAIELFLEGAGVPKEYIELLRSRIGQPTQFYSCFISYSTKDQEFADTLYKELRHKDVRCWLASEDLKIGDEFRLKINESIRQHDKLVLILSERSIESSWVEHEVKQALAREKAEGKAVLFPIRIDDAVMETPEQWAADIRKQRHIGDFGNWKEHDEYQKSLARLIRDLQPDAVKQTKSAGGSERE
jgi:hypothetical protein